MQAAFVQFVVGEMMHSAHVAGNAQDHLPEKERIPLAVLEAVVVHIADALYPDSQGLTPLQLGREEQVLGDRFCHVPDVETVFDSWQSCNRPELVYFFHQSLYLAATVGCQQSQVDARLPQSLQQDLQGERLHLAAVFHLNKKKI